MFHEPSIAQARRVWDRAACGVIAALAEVADRDAGFAYVGVDRSDRYVRATRRRSTVPEVSLVAADLRDFDPPPPMSRPAQRFALSPGSRRTPCCDGWAKRCRPAPACSSSIDAGGGWRALGSGERELSQLRRDGPGGQKSRRASDLRALVAAGFEVRIDPTVRSLARRVLLGDPASQAVR
jgi:hypothetical protein